MFLDNPGIFGFKSLKKKLAKITDGRNIVTSLGVGSRTSYIEMVVAG